MANQIVLLPNQIIRPFLVAIPNLLNGVQNAFEFSVPSVPISHKSSEPCESADVDATLLDSQPLKTALALSREDLLIRFIEEPLESRSRGLANLFVAASSLSETPPRVALISTSFIHKHILPIDPTYLIQRNAVYRLLVCSVVGSWSGT